MRTVTTDKNSYTIGSTVTITTTGWGANHPVLLGLLGAPNILLAEGTAGNCDASGKFVGTVVVPATWWYVNGPPPPGVYQAVAQDGLPTGIVAAVNITIGPAYTPTVTFHMNNTMGTIVSAGITYIDGQAKTYSGITTVSVTGAPKSGYKFTSWATQGSVSVASPTAATTNMTASGDGWLTANFAQTTPTPNAVVTFQMDNSMGTITANGVDLINGNTEQYATGTLVNVTANRKTGYKFKSWATTANVTVDNATAQSTTMHVNSSGSLTANFVSTPVTYTPTITVSPTMIKAGDTYTVTGSGFNPALPVDVHIDDSNGSSVQAPSSKSTDASGALSISIVLSSSVTYTGTAYVYGLQSDSSKSNLVQVSVSSTIVTQKRYFIRFIRIESGSVPANIAFNIRDTDTNTYLAQGTVTVPTAGVRTCFKGSSNDYDGHHISFSIANYSASTLNVTYGLDYNANTGLSGNSPALTTQSETAEHAVGVWGIFSSTDFDSLACASTPAPPGLNCDSMFPNRSTPLSWDAIGYALCVVFSPILSTLTPFFTAIGTAITTALSPFLTPLTSFTTAVTNFFTAAGDWVKDPWGELVNVASELFNPIGQALSSVVSLFVSQAETFLKPIENSLNAWWANIIASNEAFFAPLLTAIGNIKLDMSGYSVDLDQWFKGFLDWITDPVGTAFKQASKVASGFGAAANAIVKVLDPLVGMFDPSAYQTAQVKQLVTPIHTILAQGEFTWDEMVSSIFLAPWTLLYNFIEEQVVATEETDYTKAKLLATNIIQLSTDINLLILAFNALFSLLPRGVRMLDAVPHGVQALLGGLIEILAVGRIFGSAITKTIVPPLERQWLNTTKPSRPGVSDYLAMYAKRSITDAEFYSRMGEEGFSTTYSDLLYKVSLRDMALGELGILLRRGKITEAQYNTYLEKAHVDPQWATNWRELVYTDPSTYLIRQLALTGLLTDANLTDLLARRGTPPEYTDLFKKILALAPGTAQRRSVLTLMGRQVAVNKLSEAEYYAYADTSSIPRSIADPILQAEKIRYTVGADSTERAATLSMWNDYYMEGLVSPQQYHDALSDMTFSDEVIALEIAYLDKKNASPATTATRGPTLAMWNAWLTDKQVDEAVYTTGVSKLGYDLETISREIARINTVAVAPQRELLQSQAATAYKDKAITEVDYRARLASLNYAQDAIDIIVATDKASMTAATRQVSQATILKAYKASAIDRVTALGKLVDLGYNPTDAELILVTEESSWTAPAVPSDTLSRTDILDDWRDGFLTTDQTTDRLTKMGFAAYDMQLLYMRYVLDQLTAKLITSAEAEKAWIDLGVDPLVRAKLLTRYGPGAAATPAATAP